MEKTMTENEQFVVEAIESITQLLDCVNIRKIIYVDDKFDVEHQKEEIFANLKSLKREGKEIKDLEGIKWELPQAAFEGQLEQVWADWSDEEKEKCFHLISAEQEDIDVIPTAILERNLPGRLTKLTPGEWEKSKGKHLAKTNDSDKFLCLFDMKLNGNGRDGLAYVKELLDSEYAGRVYCGIFSQEFEPEDEQTWCEQKKRECAVRDFYPISKRRLADDCGIIGFTEGIKNVLLVQHIEKLKHESKEILKESWEHVRERLDAVTPPTFNRIVQKTSHDEGIWEIDSLFRLINILIDQETKKAIIDEEKRKRFKEAVKEIRNVEKVETRKPDQFVNPQLKQLQQEEIYYEGEIINALHLPLSNGDIFQIKGKEYVLLCQPCNLSIRSDGKRANCEQAFLVELQQKSIDFLGNKSKQALSAFEEIKGCRESDKLKIAYFPTFKSVSLMIFDLVVYNKEGEAKLYFQAELVPEVIHEPWRKRYGTIKKELKKYKDVIMALQHLSIENKNDKHLLNNFINSPQCMKDIHVEGIKAYDKELDAFIFPIKRIAHYKNAYSMDLLHKFMQYLSRNGFDRDFTE